MGNVKDLIDRWMCRSLDTASYRRRKNVLLALIGIVNVFVCRNDSEREDIVILISPFESLDEMVTYIRNGEFNQRNTSF